MTSSNHADSLNRLQRLWSFAEADPGNASLLRDIAAQAMGIQAYDQAIKALDALRANAQSEANDEAAAVYALFKLGRLADACERALAGRDEWPEDESLRLEASRALLNVRRYDEAWEGVQPGFQDETLAQMGAEIGMQALWQLGRLDEAAELGGQAAAQWPQSPRILALASALYFDQERTQESFALARQAHTLSPAHAYHALHVLASERLMTQDLTGAFELLEQAQQVRRDDGRIWLVKGSAHLMAGQIDEALDALQRAIEIFPEHPGSLLTLAWLYISRSQFGEAEAAVRRAIEVSPSFAESHGTLAVVQVRQGDKEGAAQSIRRATLLDKNSFAARYAQALLDGTPPGRIEELFKQVMLRSGLR